MSEVKKTFFDELGGLYVIQKVHRRFYDKIYAHPWIGKFFQDIDQSVIESQQNDFMGQSFGGKVPYLGKLPINAHKHMLISQELFDLRTKLLTESLEEERVSLENIQKWLRIDSAFKNGIVKKSVADCQKRFFTDELQCFENPEKVKKTGT
jgi:hemoglobin